MSEPTKWTPQQRIDSLAAQLHAERESRRQEKNQMNEIIQMESDDFHEIMVVLHCVGLMMAREERTKTDDERWSLFSRVIHVVTKYDARFQPDEPAMDAPGEKETAQ